jgi:HAE1 family hydrophobic/amphiphilic exporter-1
MRSSFKYRGTETQRKIRLKKSLSERLHWAYQRTIDSISDSFLLFSVSLCLCVSICFSASTHAAETRTLTLDQALSIAMEKNRDIEKAREYARYVQGKYVEERSAALPQLSLNGAASIARDESQGMFGTAARQYSRTADITLSQPLYTWGKVGAAIRAAEVGLKTAEEQLRLYRQAAYRDVSTTFYDILLTRELYRLAGENLAQKKRHQEETRRRFVIGVATDYDVLAAEVAVDNARPEVIRSLNSIQTAREKLRFLLALEGEEVDVSGSLDSVPGQPRTYQEALETARKQRPELSDAKLRIGIYDELITIAAADDKPRLDLKGSAGWHWLDINSAGTGQNDNGAAWNVGVFLTFPFFDGFRTSGRVTQARSDLRTRQIEESRLQDAVALEVREAGNAVRESSEIVQALSGTVRQAERLVQMAEKGFEFGVKIRLEVDDAQLNLVLARSNLAHAQRDYQVAQVNLLWAMGVAGE